MKKRFLIILLIFIILVFPIKMSYMDGGSVEYVSLTYKHIIWHRINYNYDSGYKTGSETHFFPNNFKNIDYFDDIMPNVIIINHKHNDIEKKYYIKSNNYNWCNSYNKCSTVTSMMSNDINDYNIITIYRNDEVSYLFNGNITNVKVYDENFKETYEKISYDEKYISYGKIKGKRIICVTLTSESGNAVYYYAINLV